MGAPSSTETERVRVVLDTNTVLSARLFPRGRLSWIPQLWMAKSIRPVVCRATARELVDTLAYPKCRLTEHDIQIVLGAYLPFTDTVEVHARIGSIPRCRDPDDQVCVSLAVRGRAEGLVTGDRALLARRGNTACAIEPAAEFKRRVR